MTIETRLQRLRFLLVLWVLWLLLTLAASMADEPRTADSEPPPAAVTMGPR